MSIVVVNDQQSYNYVLYFNALLFTIHRNRYEAELTLFMCDMVNKFELN